jgi:two-component system sensor histidine kinase KdpD
MRTRAISGPWPASERLLVCISPSPLAEKLVRTTRRLADELKAEWFAVHVEEGTKPETNLVNREHTARALQLAEELGARTRILSGRSITESILTYAQKHNVTKIVIGKPVRPRWREWINGSIVDQLIYDSGNIDVFVISSRVDGKDRVIPGGRKSPVAIMPYLIGTGMIALATIFGLLIRGNLEPANLVMLYLAATVLAALYLGRGPSFLFPSSVLAFDFSFLCCLTPPGG